MKIGFVSAILDGWSFEEMIDTAARLGYACVEVACWPAGKAERRYAGVSHIDVGRVLEDEEYAHHVLDYSRSKGVEISALAFYPNTMDGNPDKRAANIGHLKTVIRASAKPRNQSGYDIHRARPGQDCGGKPGNRERGLAAAATAGGGVGCEDRH